jgi:hypothetical protein
MLQNATRLRGTDGSHPQGGGGHDVAEAGRALVKVVSRRALITAGAHQRDAPRRNLGKLSVHAQRVLLRGPARLALRRAGLGRAPDNTASTRSKARAENNTHMELEGQPHDMLKTRGMPLSAVADTWSAKSSSQRWPVQNHTLPPRASVKPYLKRHCVSRSNKDLR